MNEIELKTRYVCYYLLEYVMIAIMVKAVGNDKFKETLRILELP